MVAASQTPPFDPRPARRRAGDGGRQGALGLAVLLAAVLNAVVWGGLLMVAKAFLRL